MRNSRIVTTFMEASISRSEIDRCRPRAPGVGFAPWVSTSPRRPSSPGSGPSATGCQGAVPQRHDAPADLADLRALLRAASGHDLERARRAISLIVARGYHRDRDLETEFNDLLRA